MDDKNERLPHERLEVWQLAKSLAKRLYEITATFPKDERFGLVDQIRRAGVSVMSNLAEGCGRTGSRDQAHFSQMAFGSLLELDAQLQLSVELKFLPDVEYERIRPATLNLVKRISALRTTQIKRANQ